MKTINLILVVATVLILACAFTNAATLPRCSDGIDNDKDGKIDYPADSGCSSSSDIDEALILGYASGCLTKGDKLSDVFGRTTYECGHTSCQTCVLMAEDGNYSSVDYKCNGLPLCGFNNGNSAGNGTVIDTEAPILTINNPKQGAIYSTKSMNLDLKSNELSSIYYKYADTPQMSWIQICLACSFNNRSRVFKEGANSLIFKFSDIKGNTAYKNLSFFVDSLAPRITKTSPTSGLTLGSFNISFTELNPKSLILTYGNSQKGFNQISLNVSSDCRKLQGKNDKYDCSKFADLSPYNNQQITYWANITDIANSKASTKAIAITVDTMPPKINSFNYTTLGRRVTFKFNITEPNFDKIYYMDTSDLRPASRTLCSALKNGYCEKYITFSSPGNHNLVFTIKDKAGLVTTKQVTVKVL